MFVITYCKYHKFCKIKYTTYLSSANGYSFFYHTLPKYTIVFADVPLSMPCQSIPSSLQAYRNVHRHRTDAPAQMAYIWLLHRSHP